MPHRRERETERPKVRSDVIGKATAGINAKMWNLFDAESLSGVEEIYTNRRRVTRSRDKVEMFSMFYSAIVIGKLGEAL
jgi:hypothetical protein